ncbi:MAG: hypothetical protein J6A59_17910 [Lachnospiraceae bacterium]|nr:hypothetical protein [Lachnospiraceae bacterium]
MVNTVSDFKIAKGVIFAVIDIKVKDKWIYDIDYIRVYSGDVELIINDDENKRRFLNLVNKIYINHIKNKLLNKGYPIFRVERYLIRRLDVTLIKYETMTGDKIDTLVVPDFVNNIYISELNAKNIMLNDRVVIGDISDKDIVRLDNLENIKYFRSKTYGVICNSVKYYQDGILVLKRITSFPSITDKVYTGINRIIFEDTVQIKNLEPSIIINNLNLSEIRLSKSIETFDNEDINNYIITDENGNKTLSYYGNSVRIID